MAKSLGLGKPPIKKTTTKQPESKLATNTTKTEAGKMVDLNFKVSAEFRKEFKVWAASHDMSQKEVLEKAFQMLKQGTI